MRRASGSATTLEIGYQGERGFHLQRAHLINNAPPGPGSFSRAGRITSRRFIAGTVLPADITVASTTFPVSSINLLENTARSWYDAGYMNIRRRYSNGLSLLANYTFAKNLSECAGLPVADVRVEHPAKQQRPRCGKRTGLRYPAPLRVERRVRHSRATSAGTWSKQRDLELAAFDDLSSPERISLHHFRVRRHGERGNGARRKSDSRQLHRPAGLWPGHAERAACGSIPAAFAVPAAYTFGNVGRNTVYGPACRRWTSRWCATSCSPNAGASRFAASCSMP